MTLFYNDAPWFQKLRVDACKKTKYRLRQTASHSSLLVDRQGDVSRKLNQAFLLVDSFSLNFADEERSDIYYCYIIIVVCSLFYNAQLW